MKQGQDKFPKMMFKLRLEEIGGRQSVLEQEENSMCKNPEMRKKLGFFFFF